MHSQRGSHVKLRRVTTSGLAQTLTVPRPENWIAEPLWLSSARHLVLCRRNSSGRRSIPDRPGPPSTRSFRG
ncbi:MAG: hypothetical protein V3S82_00080 [Dehalococcoidia bacterium]